MKGAVIFAVVLCFCGLVSSVPHADEARENELKEYYKALGIETEARECIKLNDKCDEHDGEWCCNWGITGCGCSYSWNGADRVYVSHCRCMSRAAVAALEYVIPGIKRT